MSKFPRLFNPSIKTLISLGFGLSGFGMLALPSQAVQQNQTPAERQEISYLYGQAPQPNQPQQGYVVFEQFDNMVVGASYYPRSEFQCFIGTLDGQSDVLSGIALTSLQAEQSQLNIDLSTLHELNTLSENDQRMLATCKQSAVKRQNQLPSQWQKLPSALR